MIEKTAAQKLRSRYLHVDPVLFKKSCDYARNLGDLFDILEGLPKVYPIVWNESKRQWVTVDDILTLNKE